MERLEQIYLNRSGQHEVSLKKVADQLTPAVLEPKIFSPQAEKELASFFDQNEEAATSLFDFVLNSFPSLEIASSPGHGLAHVTDNLATTVRVLANEERPLHEEVEVLLGVTLHDADRRFESVLGRIAEKEEGLTPSQAASLLILSGAKKLARENDAWRDFPAILAKRVIYDIATGSEAKTDHWTADLVHQCDREQLIGPATIARGLAFDVVESGRKIPVPERESLIRRLPLPERPEDTDWLIQYEFFMRNIYPPVSADGAETWQKIKSDNAAILILATLDKEAAFRQIFAPELGLVDSGECHWSKRKMPAEILASAQRQVKEFLATTGKEFPYQAEVDLVAIATGMLVVEGIALPERFEEKLKVFIDECNEVEKRNLYYLLLFSIQKRREDRNQMIELSEQVVQDSRKSGVLKTAARFVIDQYQVRNQRDQSIFAF